MDEQRRLALPYSFPIVDAGVARWLASIQAMDGPDEPSLTARRQQTTTGSCHYFLALALHTDHLRIATIVIQAVGETMTSFEIQATESERRNDGITELMTGLIDAVQRYFQDQDADMQELLLVSQRRSASIPPIPDRDADAETHARWQAEYGARLGYSIQKYAKEVMVKSPKTLYNARSTLNLTQQSRPRRKSGNRGKKAGK